MARTAARLRVKFNNLPEVERRMPGAVSGLVSDGGDRIVDGAKRLVPVDTGALRDSIRKEMSPGAPSCRVEAFGDRAAGEGYALFVEFGTRHAPAQPFLRPAASEEEPRLLRAWRELEGMVT